MKNSEYNILTKLSRNLRSVVFFQFIKLKSFFTLLLTKIRANFNERKFGTKSRTKMNKWMSTLYYSKFSLKKIPRTRHVNNLCMYLYRIDHESNMAGNLFIVDGDHIDFLNTVNIHNCMAWGRRISDQCVFNDRSMAHMSWYQAWCNSWS